METPNYIQVTYVPAPSVSLADGGFICGGRRPASAGGIGRTPGIRCGMYSRGSYFPPWFLDVNSGIGNFVNINVAAGDGAFRFSSAAGGGARS